MDKAKPPEQTSLLLETIEAQGEIISLMSGLLRRYAVELAEARTIAGMEAIDSRLEEETDRVLSLARTEYLSETEPEIKSKGE